MPSIQEFPFGAFVVEAGFIGATAIFALGDGTVRRVDGPAAESAATGPGPWRPGVAERRKKKAEPRGVRPSKRSAVQPDQEYAAWTPLMFFLVIQGIMLRR